MVHYSKWTLNIYSCVSFFVGIIVAPPLGLKITEFTLQSIITVLCCYVSLQMSLHVLTEYAAEDFPVLKLDNHTDYKKT